MFLKDNDFVTLEDVPDDVLKQVLLNHVVSGKVVSTDLKAGYVPGVANGPNQQVPKLTYTFNLERLL